MNLPYIQSELFRELVGMEVLFKPEYRWYITKRSNGAMKAILIKKHGVFHWWKYEFHLNPLKIMKPSDITDEITRIWDAIPAKCKKMKTLI